MSRNEKRTADRDALRLFAKKALIVVGFAIGLLVLWSIRRILLILFVATVLAAGIAPAVRRVRAIVRTYTRRRIKRGTAVLLVYFPFLIAAIVFAVVALPHILIESRQLARELPALIDRNLLEPLAPYLPTAELEELLASSGDPEETRLFGYVRGAIGVISSGLAVLILIVYILIDAERLRNLILLSWPAGERAARRRMIVRIARRMSSWLSGQILFAGVVGGATFVGLLLLGVPYAIPLGVVAAIGEIVPVIGPIVGAIPALGVALVQSPEKFWYVLALALGIQFLENYLLVPRFMARRVAISPLSVVIAFMIGASLFGIVGAVMAVPGAAITQVLFEEWFVAKRERRLDVDRPGSLTKSET